MTKERMIWVELLSDGKISWHKIPWGKAHLDYIRKFGIILFYSEQ